VIAICFKFLACFWCRLMEEDLSHFSLGGSEIKDVYSLLFVYVCACVCR